MATDSLPNFGPHKLSKLSTFTFLVLFSRVDTVNFICLIFLELRKTLLLMV